MLDLSRLKNSVPTVWSGEGKRNYPQKKIETPQTEMGPTLSFKHRIQVMKGLKSVQNESVVLSWPQNSDGFSEYTHHP